MKVKARKKATRQKGAGGRTCGYGFRQKHKGHGNKGGIGMSGTGKRGDHKRLKAVLLAKTLKAKSYFGKQGVTSRGTEREKSKQINLIDIQKNFSGAKIDLKDYKILGKGDGFKAEIIAKAASKTAIEKMSKAGGSIVLPNLSKKEE